MATISQRISIEGSDDIRKKLEELGKAGEQAFKQIQDAAAKPIIDSAAMDKTQAAFDALGVAVAKAIEQISEAVGNVDLKKFGADGEKAAKGVDKVAESSTQAAVAIKATAAATDETSKAMSSLSLQTVKTSAEIVKLVVEIGKLGVEIGFAITKHAGLTESLIKLALHAATARAGLSLLQPTLAAVGITVGTTAVAFAAAGAGIVAAGIGLVALGAAAGALAAPYEKLNNQFQTLALNSGQSFDQLQRGQALFAQMGISAETFRGTIAKLSQTLGDLDIKKELQKSADSIVDANKKVLEAEKAVIAQRVEGRQVFLIGEDTRLTSYLGDVERLKQLTAELSSETNKAKELEDALLAARQKATEAAANSLSKVLEKVQAIEKGQKGITFDSLVKADTIVTAFAISLQRAKESGDNAGQTLLNFIANAERAQAIQIGAKFGLTDEQVDRVRRLGGHLGIVDETWKRIQSAGLLIPPENAAAFAKLTEATDRLNASKERLSQAWDTSAIATFGAQFDTIVIQIKTALNNAGAAVLEFFATLNFTSLGNLSNTVREFEAIGAAVVNAAHAVGDFITTLGTVTWDAISSAGVAAWNAITDAIRRAIDAVLKFIGLRPSGGGSDAAAPAPGLARGGRIGGRGSGTSDSNLAWLSRGEFVMPASAVRQPGMLALLEALRRGGNIPGFAAGGLVAGSAPGVMDVVRRMIITVGNTIGQMTFAVIDPMRGVMNTIDRVMREFSDSSQRLLDILVEAEGVLADFIRTAGFARGGLLGGRGSGTSDSNLAWVSRGEHIMPAHAVRQPGVLAFLEALRRSGGDLSRVFDGMGRFATGGLVTMPALAAGGISGMSNVTIQFPGLPAIGGLRASSQVVEELQRAAAMAQVRSGGRKPSRYT